MADRQEIEALIARVAIGDRAAFGMLYDATSAKLFGIILRVLNDRDLSEDALQEVYVKIWRNAQRYKVNGLSPMTWLITIARNHAIDRLRRARAIGSAPMDDGYVVPDPAPGPEAQAMARSQSDQLTACLDELDPDNAQAVRRVYLEGETYDTLARHFAVPLNTMRTRLRRSRVKLKECLGR